VICLKSAIVQKGFDEAVLVEEKLAGNPLIQAIGGVLGRVAEFKEKVRAFYFEVILSPYQCPECNGRLHMTGQSECSCSCGNIIDPTTAFQKSSCCAAGLVRKTYHYVCSRCQRIVPSRFLFDERVFDKTYFREMMRESRTRAKKRREAIAKLLAESRSGTLPFTDEPCLESLSGLIEDLDDFVQNGSSEPCQLSFDTRPAFHMNDYRNHILSTLSWNPVLFSDINPIIEDHRRDRVWRFITLVFMQNDREVDFTQDGKELMVQKVYNEAYNQG